MMVAARNRGLIFLSSTCLLVTLALLSYRGIQLKERSYHSIYVEELDASSLYGNVNELLKKERKLIGETEKRFAENEKYVSELLIKNMMQAPERKAKQQMISPPQFMGGQTSVQLPLNQDKDSIQILKDIGNFIVTLGKRMDAWDEKLKVITSRIDQIRTPKVERKTTVLNLGDQRNCQNLHLLILISSNISHVGRRQLIRDTWGKRDRYKILETLVGFTYDTFFLVGSVDDREDMLNLRKESMLYRDIVHVSGNEGFYDLSRKVMTGLQWANKHCSYKFLLKGDDDIFVNIPNTMILLLSKFLPQEKLYTGASVLNAIPFRKTSADKYEKYAVSFEEWPYDSYPYYCSGGGFFLSTDVVEGIIPYFDWINPLKIDDVYVGWLVERFVEHTQKKIKHLLLNPDLFSLDHKPPNCSYVGNAVIQHKVIHSNCMHMLDSGAGLNIVKAFTQVKNSVKYYKILTNKKT